MGKVNPEVRKFYGAYLKKRLRPDTALEVGRGFVLDLINSFGEPLAADATPKDGWVLFRPAKFLQSLNAVLDKFNNAGGKIPGYAALSDLEKSLTSDNSLLLGSLVEFSLSHSDPPAVDEERFQIPKAVADDLSTLARDS